jgi:DNA-binding NarL/FixJ family response regulator
MTPREREVLSLMAQGKSNRGIAESLVVSVAAVERHVTGIFGKLDLAHRPEDHLRVLAVLQYLQNATPAL